MKKYVPNRITRSRKSNARMNTETRRMVRRKNHAFTKAQFTMSSRQYVNDLFGRLTMHAYKTLFAMMLEKIPQNWSFVKNKKQDASGVAPLY